MSVKEVAVASSAAVSACRSLGSADGIHSYKSADGIQSWKSLLVLLVPVICREAERSWTLQSREKKAEGESYQYVQNNINI